MTNTTTSIQQKTEETWQKFLLSAISCATPLPLVNPIEVTKIRMQLQGELIKNDASTVTQIYGKDVKYKGMMRGMREIYLEEGIAGLYKGIAPAALRECTYAAMRLALYDPIKEAMGERRSENRELSLTMKLIAGGTAGCISAAICNPTDVLKIRMQADNPPKGVPPRYTSLWNGFTTILRTEGIAGLYKGTIPTTQRAALVAAALMPSYDHTKQFLLRHNITGGDNIYAHITSGMVAGFMSAAVSSPIDVVKTRFMNEALAGSRYAGVWSCLHKTIKAEGVFGLYKGFVPNYMRLGPHTVMAMTLLEALRKAAGLKPM